MMNVDKVNSKEFTITNIQYSPYENLTNDEILNLTREKISEMNKSGDYGTGTPISEGDFFGRDPGLPK